MEILSSFKRIAPIVLAAFLLFASLSFVSPIGGSSEAREAHVAEMMRRTGQVILPRRAGFVPSKPPLNHWISAGIAGTLGVPVSPGIARIPAALGAAIMVGLVALAIQFLAGPSMVPLAVSVLLSTYGFTALAMDARVDSIFAALVLLAVALSLLRTAPAVWSWGVCGLAVLAKGPLGLILPGLVSYLLAPMPSRLRAVLRPQWGWLVFGIVAGSWYGAAIVIGGYEFVARQILFENLHRFAGGEALNTEPWWYYIPAFIRGGLPWSLVAIGLVCIRLRQGHWGAFFREPAGRIVITILAVILFFSLASGKRQSYLLPLYPLLAILVVLLLQGWPVAEPIRRFTLRWWPRIVGLGLFVISCWAIVLWTGLIQGYLALGWAGIIVVIWLVVATVLLRRAQALSSFCIILAVAITLGSTTKNNLKGFDDIAAQILAQVRPGEPLFVLRTRADEFFDPALYYLCSFHNRCDVTAIDPASVQPCPIADGSPRSMIAHAELNPWPGWSIDSAVLRLRSDLIQNRPGRGIVLWRCG